MLIARHTGSARFPNVQTNPRFGTVPSNFVLCTGSAASRNNVEDGSAPGLSEELVDSTPLLDIEKDDI